MGLFTAIGVTLAATAVGTAIYGATQQSKASKEMKQAAQKAAKQADMPAAPAIPKPAAAQATAQAGATKKKKAMARSRSVRTSPLGIAGEADVARKTLLGQ